MPLPRYKTIHPPHNRPSGADTELERLARQGAYIRGQRVAVAQAAADAGYGDDIDAYLALEEHCSWSDGDMDEMSDWHDEEVA